MATSEPFFLQNVVTFVDIFQKKPFELNATENIHYLQQKNYECRMSKGDSISSFVGDVKLIVNQLHALSNITFDESAVMVKILTNLLNCYDHLATMWDSVIQDDYKVKS
jgi:hypothetical protein